MNDTMLRATVTARQRLLLGTASEVAYFTGSHSFVPGSVLRGALAAAWIAEHGPPTGGGARAQRFRELFDGEIRYGPLQVPGSFREPLSVWRCKYPRDEACRRVAVDRAFEDGDACPRCGRPLAQSKATLALPDQSRLRRSTRTSIDPASGLAKDGELYAHDGLPAKTVLTGPIYGRDAWLEQPRTLRLGGRRTVSGAAEFRTEPAPPQSLQAPLTANGALVIRLVSPAVFVDTAGRPLLEPDPALDLDGMAVADKWVRPVAWSGWHAASRLPKPAEVCAEAGSTYLLRGDREGLARLARRLLAEGLGLRRVEGFGSAEVVTQPWRPRPEPQPARPADPAVERLEQVRGLRLARPERRWLVGALRGLQIEQQRSEEADLDHVLVELLAQPTAAGLSGRQRDAIRTIVAGLDPAGLRDLTTLVEATT
jgi:CRISPR-associated protein Csx10